MDGIDVRSFWDLVRSDRCYGVEQWARMIVSDGRDSWNLVSDSLHEMLRCNSSILETKYSEKIIAKSRIINNRRMFCMPIASTKQSLSYRLMLTGSGLVQGSSLDSIRFLGDWLAVNEHTSIKWFGN